MADKNEINNQKNLNQEIENQLSLEQEILLVLNKRAGISNQVLSGQQDLNNLIQDQVKQLNFETNEKRLIRDLTNQITKLSEKAYTVTKDELGLSKTRLGIKKDQEKLDKSSFLLNQQINKIESDSKEVNKEKKEIYSDLLGNLKKQLGEVTKIKKELDDVKDTSSSIEKSFGVKTFGTLKDVFTQIPGLKRFSAPFEEAAEAAREQAVYNFQLHGSTKKITEEEIKQLQLTNEKIDKFENLNDEAEDYYEKLEEIGEIKFKPDDVKFGEGVNEESQKSFQEAIKNGESLSAALNNAGIKAKQITIPKKAIPSGKSLSPFRAGINSIGKAMGGLISKAGIIGMAITAVTKIFKFFKEAMFEADEQITSMRKSLNMSRDAAEGVRERMFGVSDEARNLATIQESQVLTQQDIYKAQNGFNEALGTSIDLTSMLGKRGEKILAQFASMSKFLNLSKEEQKGLIQLQTISGETIDDTVTQLLGEVALRKAKTGIMVNERKVLESILTTSNATKLTLEGHGKSLGNAAFQAARLGLNITDLESTSNSLLDFQSSIEAEMQAELLVGKQLNLERARYAALTGDSATLAKELYEQIGTSAEFGRLNIIQQEAYAKALGKSREEIADILVAQETLNNLRTNFDASTQDILKNLEEEGKIAKGTVSLLNSGEATVKDFYKALKEANLSQKEMVKLFGENTLANMQSQTAQQKWNDTLQKAQGIFSRLVDGGILQKFSNLLSDFVTVATERSMFAALTGGIEEAESKRIVKESADLTEQFKNKTPSKQNTQQIQEKLDSINAQIEQVKGFNLGNILSFNSRFSSQNTQLATLRYQQTQLESLLSSSSQADDFIIRPGHPIQKFRKDDIVIGGTNLLGGQESKEVITRLNQPVQKLGQESKEVITRLNQPVQKLGQESKEVITRPNQLVQKLGQESKEVITRPNQPVQKLGQESKEVITLLKTLVSAVKEGGDVYIDGNKVGKSLAMSTSRMG